MFQKILIANRGEIAVRIIRACREMGIKTVAVYSSADRECLHTQLADEAVCIGPAKSQESYLNMERILSAAEVTGAEAIHPGFGFLSENSKFADLCGKCGITFIGPSARVIRSMGDKAQARKTMIEAGVPVVPGSEGALTSIEEAKALADQIGYPVIVKASAGGGGKGMRIVESEREFHAQYEMARREAQAAFGDDTMYLEKYIQSPRHIEFQVMADRFGNVVHLGERDCSIQRRHQKMIEEAPSAAISDQKRKAMGETAVKAARAAGYENAGTIEFLLDKDGSYYFIEMNTRIQVEHPITEMVTGIDLIKEQILIAAGRPLSFEQQDVEIKGHAIECRINAEDPAKDFRPCPGTVENMHVPGGNGVRIDTAIFNGYTVPASYDSMIMKVIIHDRDREHAIQKMRSTLGELVIEGIGTNLDFQYEILNHEVYQNGEVNTHFIQTYFENE